MKPIWLRLAVLAALTMFLITACNSTPADPGPGTGDPINGDPDTGDPGNGDPGDGDPGNGDPGDGDPGNGDPGDGDPGDDSPIPEGTITKLGMVNAGVLSDETDAFAFGIFMEVDEGDIVDFVNQGPVPIEFCLLATDDGYDDVAPYPEPPAADPLADLLSAGDSLTLNRPSLTPVELSRLTGPGLPPFYTGVIEGGELPSGSTLDIPGDEFPAFSGIAMPPLALPVELTGYLADSTLIDSARGISWQPQASAGTDVWSLVAFVFELTGSGTEATCITPDSGSLDFPAPFIADTGTFTAELVAASRFNMRVEMNAAEEAAVILQTLSSTDFSE